MSLNDDLRAVVDDIITTPWDVTDGTVVPEVEDIKLKGGGRKLEVVMLYADLEDSTALVSYNRQLAAKVIKCFLACCTRIIKANGGAIRSFDGDRVMGVFIAGNKNTNAAKAGLNIKWAFDKVIVPALEEQYASVRDGTVKLGYSVGIASGDVLVVRAGVPGSNDLLWIGRVANIAAKLSDIRRTPYRTFISENVYQALLDPSKLDDDGKDMWTKFAPKDPIGVFYGSSYHWGSF